MLQFIKSTIAFIGAIFFSAVNKLFCSPCVQKYVAYFWLGFFTVSDAMASSKGAGGFTKATTEIQSYETPVANLMKAIAAVIVLVGAFNVYFKMQKSPCQRPFQCSSSKRNPNVVLGKVPCLLIGTSSF